MRSTLVAISFCMMCFQSSAQKVTDTFKFYFDLNVPTLSEKMQNKIDLLIYNDKIISGSKVIIIGYADYLGSEGHNKKLSMARAENVKNYLVKYGIRPEDVKLCLGQGEVNRDVKATKDGYPKDRRVDIVMDNTPLNPPVPPKPVKKGKDTTKGKNVVLTKMEDMTKLKPGTIFQLNNVYFPPDRHVIQPESYTTLEKLFQILKDNPRMKISIEGHVCCISMDAPDALDVDTQEPTLSVNRAKAIYNFLVEKGIDPERLKYAGFGKHHPVVAHEQTEGDKEKNRRVEVRIVEN